MSPELNLEHSRAPVGTMLIVARWLVLVLAELLLHALELVDGPNYGPVVVDYLYSHGWDQPNRDIVS